MSIASPKHARRVIGSDATLVENLYRRVTALSRAVRTPSPELLKSRQLDDLAEATALLAGAPALSMAEVVAKLTILCRRLRDDLHPEVGGELITYLLAESVCDDCRLLANADVNEASDP